MRYLFVLLLPLIFYSCSKYKCRESPDVSGIDVTINLKRLEQEMFNINDENSMRAFLASHPEFSKQFLNMDQYPNDSILAATLLKLVKDPYIDSLYRQVQDEFEDLEELTNELELAFKNIKYYFPEFNPPKVYTIVTGLGDGSDLFVSEDIIVIGLDFFLGRKAKYRPVEIPQYILNRYERAYIVPSVVLFISQGFNQNPSNDQSMLGDMIYYGKSYYFTETILPCTPDSLIIGYSKLQLDDVEKNQRIIWSHFIENQLLYETSHLVKDKYMSERPATLEIGNKAPGRIGGWLGWKIVRHFMKNTNSSLSELMKINNSQKIFKESEYRPD